jgi:hypothetical protein
MNTASRGMNTASNNSGAALVQSQCLISLSLHKWLSLAALARLRRYTGDLMPSAGYRKQNLRAFAVIDRVNTKLPVR